MGTTGKLRRAAIEKPYLHLRKDYCENCGTKGEVLWKMAGDYKFKSQANKMNQLTAHHIDHNPANNDPSNIQTLCRKCHDEVHNIINK